MRQLRRKDLRMTNVGSSRVALLRRTTKDNVSKPFYSLILRCADSEDITDGSRRNLVAPRTDHSLTSTDMQCRDRVIHYPSSSDRRRGISLNSAAAEFGARQQETESDHSGSQEIWKSSSPQSAGEQYRDLLNRQDMESGRSRPNPILFHSKSDVETGAAV